MLINCLHVNHAHFMNQYLGDFRRCVRWWNNIFQQWIIDRQLIFRFFRASYQFYVLIKKTSCRQHVFFYLLDFLQTFNQLFDEERSQVIFFSLFVYFINQCFLSLNFLQLFLLIDVAVRCYDNCRRRVNFALSSCLRRDIKRSMIYVLRIKLNTFEIFKHFQQHNKHENNRVWRFHINWEKKYSNNEFDDYRFEHDI